MCNIIMERASHDSSDGIKGATLIIFIKLSSLTFQNVSSAILLKDLHIIILNYINNFVPYIFFVF